ncbi:hypothetical protein U3E08_004190 [Salmonella enterica]|nr:hypothetical protein [Salmonella enterica]ELP9382983.1 hypothetical protein [Salmonella enterica]EMA5319151.1 hypothetical protein [Salmonella enterica]
MNRILPPVRGLNIRVQWGMARVMRVIDPVKARGEEADALFEAQQAGYQDFGLGEFTPPHMFADEPQLVKAWTAGMQFAKSCDETENCEFCQREESERCPLHG